MERVIAVEETGNFRDLGGYPTAAGTTRWRRLMRADALADLSDRGRDRLTAIGLRTIVDLREPVEREMDPNAVAGTGAVTHERPLFEGRIDVTTVRGLRGLYRELLEVCGDRIAEVVGVLAAPGALPGVVHCSAGKDRTGLVCAVTLSALGVPDRVVAADYALTAEVLTGEFREKVRARAIAAGMTEQAVAVAMSSPPELMMEVLAGVREEHGGAAAFLFDHGLEPQALERLREAVVAPAR